MSERLELFSKVCECGSVGTIIRRGFLIDKPFGCTKCFKTYSHEDLKYITVKPISLDFQVEMKQLLKECLGIE
jgi:hypothetical protein